MLDTRARKFIQPFFNLIADLLIKNNISANQVTIFAFILGLTINIFILTDFNLIAVIILWISGALDAVDGTIARKTKTSSQFGTIMDIVFDRLVEIGMIITLAIKNSNATFSLLLLTSSIVITMTIFLSVGAVANKKGEKSFYYQPGLAERTEGFIFFTFMILFQKYLIIITMMFFIAIIYTAFQRFKEAHKILTK
ncbi:phosphatidylglycerophosphate synthase [Hypnocyclicus thermotrophus]|uniref:Phosphatidylglycerophosphate synthase n=1 Tax=Hypnocyclicus thermotrophus TaxID=1627895 RepID=A0AA46I6M6_9FUSO|nr:CDP-alcohol phosphatidyltransferase family protein [Hypnocyclicus thermotrophus]TDT72595.1 phosphatidylglycerophosphate synthase [Hypnocyclicus thermotrophus]